MEYTSSSIGDISINYIYFVLMFFIPSYRPFFLINILQSQLYTSFGATALSKNEFILVILICLFHICLNPFAKTFIEIWERIGRNGINNRETNF